MHSSTSFTAEIVLMVALFMITTITTLRAVDIPIGSTISASDPTSRWSSPDSTFTFTFIPQEKLLDPTTTVTASAVYYAAILYDNSFPIWVAGGCSLSGGAVDSSATLRLFPDGNLVLQNGSSSTFTWQSNTARLAVSTASLDDSGNFVLKNSTSSNIWSTFDNPTDTIVPNQTFTLENTLRSASYTFKLLENGNVSLNWTSSSPSARNVSVQYFNSLLYSNATSIITSPTLSIESTGTVVIHDPGLRNPSILVYSSDYGEQGDILRFLKLDSDGNLRIYSSTKGSRTKNVRWSAVSDQCEVFGYCGDNGICSYIDSAPVCGCASQNFEFVDPKNTRQGCKRKVDITDCPENATMLTLNNTVFLTYPPETLSRLPVTFSQAYWIGISACRANCLANSACSASTSLADGSGFCYLKLNDQTNFLSGYQSPALPSTSFVKLCQPVLPNPLPTSAIGSEDKHGWRLKAWIVVLIVLGAILCLILLESGFWWWCLRNSPRFGRMSTQYALLEYASGAPVQFSYKELQRATRWFKEKLGAGGFGAVYGGVLANKTAVAVKQLEGIEQGEKQFRMEVATISSTHHLNLVRLIGFCSTGHHRLLVYEFMRNGSLDKFLFTPEQLEKLLNWESRYNIALGTARGITYLHEECRDCIIHCDIKPENILLDENYNAKVSDFGLAKLISAKDHVYRTLTSVRGTRGYLAPEWLANLPITSKSDIYSFGMVLLEIVSGKRNFQVSAETNQKKFSVWAYQEFEKGNAEAIIDKRLSSHDIDREQVMRVIQVSFWCIQEQPSQRPTMGKVVQMLEGILEIERPPAPAPAPALGSSSIYSSSISISAFSTFAVTSSTPSSAYSLQAATIASSGSGKNVERASSSLLRSIQN